MKEKEKNLWKSVDKRRRRWYYVQAFRRKPWGERKRSEEFLKKVSKKSWQREYSVIYSLSCLRKRIAIGPWKLNNEIRKGTRDSMVKIPSRRVFKSTFQTVIRKLNSEVYKTMSAMTNERQSSENDWNSLGCLNTIFREFDPGSGRTLAACLTHASRTKHLSESLRGEAFMT